LGLQGPPLISLAMHFPPCLLSLSSDKDLQCSCGPVPDSAPSTFPSGLDLGLFSLIHDAWIYPCAPSAGNPPPALWFSNCVCPRPLFYVLAPGSPDDVLLEPLFFSPTNRFLPAKRSSSLVSTVALRFLSYSRYFYSGFFLLLLHFIFFLRHPVFLGFLHGPRWVVFALGVWSSHPFFYMRVFLLP